MVARLLSGASVRPDMEDIEGSPCYVVDIHDGSETLWLDPARGYLPVQQHIYGGPRGDRWVAFEIHVTEAVQVTENAWLPTAGRRFVPLDVGGGIVPPGTEFSMAIPDDENGQLRLAVNRGVEDESFNIEASLPAGTSILDLDNGIIWVSEAGGFAGLADTALAQLPARDTSAGSAAASLGFGSQWFGTMGIFALGSVAFFVVTRRR